MRVVSIVVGMWVDMVMVIVVGVLVDKVVVIVVVMNSSYGVVEDMLKTMLEK